MATIHVATLRSFDSGTYKARVTLKGSLHMSLDGVRVNRAIPSGEMVAGREVTVIIYDETKTTDAVVAGVYA